METKGNILLVFCTLLLLSALFVLTMESLRWQSISDKEMRWFQQLTGGLGMGAVTAPSWNIIDFDPRLQPIDESKLWPLPGSYSYSPASACSVTYFKEQDAYMATP